VAAKLNTLILSLAVGAILSGCSPHGDSEWGELIKKGDAAFAAGQFGAARENYDSALASLDKTDGDSKERTNVLNKVAHAAQAQGNISQAESIYNQAVTQAEHDFGKDCEQELVPLEGLRRLYEKTKDNQKNQDTATRILAISDKVLKPNDIRVENAISNLIGVECLNGVCKNDTGLLDRLLDVRTKRYGPDAQVTITARQMAAEGKLHHKDYLGAASLYKMNAESYAKHHSGLVTAATVQYAVALHRAGKNAEAYAALKPIMDKPPVEKQRYVSALATYGEVCGDLNKKDEAQKAFTTMSAEARKAYGDNSETLAAYLVRWSEFLKKAGRTQQAADLDKTIATIYKR
jgi:tetratricopeptide (TPR) repeat protein